MVLYKQKKENINSRRKIKMKYTYEIKNKEGKIMFVRNRRDYAISCYEYVEKNYGGYAELWRNGECILKTK